MKKEILIGIINPEKNKGYSSSATSLVNASENTENIIFDLSKDSMDDVKAKVKDILSQQNSLKIISAGDMGIDVFNSLLTDNDIKNAENKIQFILNSDKYYANDLDMKKITLIMPNVAIKEFKEKNPDLKITSYPADFVASPSKEELQKRARIFRDDNKAITEEMFEEIIYHTEASMFVGGRVSDGKGGWKENTPEIFERAAKDYMKVIEGSNGSVVFHGLRSFTNAKGENDFAPVEKFYEVVRSSLTEGQAVAFFTKSDDGKGDDGKYKRSPLFKVIVKQNGEINEENHQMVVNSPAGEYYFLLNETIDRGMYMLATGEQMNFAPEATEMGADIDDIYFYNWELTVPSNIATQEDILKYYRETRKLPMNATKAFKKLLSDEEKLKSAALSQAKNR